MRRASLSSLAQREFRDAAEWIKADSPKAARRFRAAVSLALDEIGAHPHIGAQRPDLTGRSVRFWRISGFPYVAVYFPDRDPALVLRLLHGARDLETLLG
jgi:toxin ParE1/3/4